MPRNERRTGGCACGAVRYRLKAAPMRVHCCHCHACQKQTGGAFAINAIVETANIALTKGRPVAVPVPREHGPHEIYRCRRCQTALWSDYGRKPGVRFLRAATLDDPHALKPDIHIFTRAKVPWIELTDGKPAFRDYYRTKKVWPRAAYARLQAALGRS
ncbi:MAG: GFA family protein [Elusimicrobia bacterium]|nr:GFA family protein [Elusimicrobiota bacterium]